MYFNFVSGVFINKGYQRSVLINCNKSEYIFVPNSLCENFNSLEKTKDLNIDIKDFLIKNEYIYELNEIHNSYLPQSFTHRNYFDLDCLMINLENFDLNFLKYLCSNFNICNLIFEGHIFNENFLIDDIAQLNCNGIFLNIYNNDISIEYLQNILIYDIVVSVMFIDCKVPEGLDSKKIKNKFENNLFNENSLLIDSYFIIESLEYNPVLNKTLYLQNNKLYESKNKLFTISIVENQFKSKKLNSIWNSKKSSTEVCSNCEFSLMCPDKRIPFSRKNNNMYFHLTECNYNPFISKWIDEEGYKTLEECGVISNEHEFSIDHEKVALINNELWEDE